MFLAYAVFDFVTTALVTKKLVLVLSCPYSAIPLQLECMAFDLRCPYIQNVFTLSVCKQRSQCTAST